MKKCQETIEEKLKRLSKCDPDTGCLVWTGGRNGTGYGQMQISTNRQRHAHVVAWERVHGLRPKGFRIRRTCGNRLCINVQHMVLFNALDAVDDIEWQLDRLKRGIIVNHSTHCWEWQGSKVKGYGRLCVGKHYVTAHRLMWKCTHRETQGLWVLHKCDNPCCVNPEHLFLGTHTDNMQDRTIKNRAGVKLNAEAVRDIRTSKLSLEKLAEKYGVSIRTIYSVLNHKTWRHIE